METTKNICCAVGEGSLNLSSVNFAYVERMSMIKLGYVICYMSYIESFYVYVICMLYVIYWIILYMVLTQMIYIIWSLLGQSTISRSSICELWIEWLWPENSANLYARHTETLDSCFDLIMFHQQCIPWSLPLDIEPATTDCRAKILWLRHQLISHTSDASDHSLQSCRVSAMQSMVAGSISSGGNHGIHCWWDLIRLKQLSSVSVCHA